MNPTTPRPATAMPVDPDLAEQARPGYGVPSQDPRPAAQQPLALDEAARESRSVLMGGGVVAGAATGAAVGGAVAGPVGVVVGGTLGGVAGALGSAAASATRGPHVAAGERDAVPGAPAAMEVRPGTDGRPPQ